MIRPELHIFKWAPKTKSKEDFTEQDEIRSSIELLKNDTKFYLKEIKDLKNENKELRLLIENSFKILHHQIVKLNKEI